MPPRLPVLFEDRHLIVLLKPAGLATANAPQGVESVFSILHRDLGPRASSEAGADEEGFLGVVSRLDAPVSGAVVVARTRAAAAELSRQFRDRTVDKEYVAVVEGRFPGPLGTWLDWNDQLEDHDSPGTMRAAHVRARVVRRAGEVSLVELQPSTGRRHQLRLQLSSRRCPIVGDRRYGARLPFEDGIALHSSRLALDHPATGERLILEATLPAGWGERFPSLFRTPVPRQPDPGPLP